MSPIELKNAFFSLLLDRGIIGERYRIEITDIEVTSSDWAKVYIDVFRPRCRKPFGTWEIAVWVPGGNVHWDKSQFIKK